MDPVFLSVWIGLMVVIIPISILSRKLRNEKPQEAQEYVTAAFTVAFILALSNVLIKITTQEKLQVDLGWDGVVALFIGSCYGIYISLKGIAKLF